MAEADRSMPGSDDGLDALRGEIARCRICRDMPFRGMADRLPHEPRPVVILSGKARILIAGQAPGLRVHETGLPFNDASGDRLRQWLNVDRETFYDPNRFAIVPMGFCFPGYDDKGSDLPPRRECAPSWRERVMAAMPQVELILAVGQYAQAFHLGERRRRTMTATVQDWRSYLHANSGPGIFPLPHPSWRNTGWLKKNPWFTQELLPVLRQHVEMRL
nr:uracil-DNA glycosylase family protein [uncultured Agrobacterium sp.]